MKAAWETKPLGEVCEIIKGRKPKLKTEQTKDDFPYLVAKVLRGSKEAEFAAKEDRNSILVSQHETIIICDGSNSGEVFTGFDGILSSTMGKLAVNANIDGAYLRAFLDSTFELFNGSKTGSAIPHLDKDAFYGLPFSYPPLPEQRRIVAILDAAFAAIATARAHTEQNLRNARELFESQLAAVFSQRGAGWVETKEPLSSLCELIVDCEHKTAPTQAEGIPSIRTPNIGKGKLLLDGVYRVSEATYREWIRRAEPQEGDLIFAREAPAGNVGVVPAKLKVCLGQRTVLIRPKRSIFVPDFLALLLLCPAIQKILLGHSRGATVQHVNMKDIRALNVGAIPSLSMQSEIATKFEAVAQESQTLQSLAQRKLAALDELKQSLLQQAFSGQL